MIDFGAKLWLREDRLSYLGASLGAVHDCVAAVKRKGVLELRQSFLGELIPRVNHPAISLQMKTGSFGFRRKIYAHFY